MLVEHYILSMCLLFLLLQLVYCHSVSVLLRHWLFHTHSWSAVVVTWIRWCHKLLLLDNWLIFWYLGVWIIVIRLWLIIRGTYIRVTRLVILFLREIWVLISVFIVRYLRLIINFGVILAVTILVLAWMLAWWVIRFLHVLLDVLIFFSSLHH